MDLDLYLKELQRMDGSDLHLKVGRPPLFRVRGDLLPTESAPLTKVELTQALFNIMDERQIKQFEEIKECDLSYMIPGVARFRVNLFQQQGNPACVMRLVPLEVPTIEGLGLPKVVTDIADNENGLALVTGPTGSGKSTTLAAMIQRINTTSPVHILTVEDPVEFVYTDEQATINQRELGIDSISLQNALRGALRQDPDIILMGEMRDPETIRFGITAAETGHYVFATLHTNDATQTIDRILDTMPPDAREMVRSQLAIILRGIICQRLCKRADGTGRIAAQEILVNSPAISQLIEEAKTRSIEKALGEGSYYGMQTFNQALYNHVQAGAITQEEALQNSTTPDDLRLMFRGVMKGTSADETSEQGGGGDGIGFKSPTDVAPDAPASKKPGRGFDF